VCVFFSTYYYIEGMYVLRSSLVGVSVCVCVCEREREREIWSSNLSAKLSKLMMMN